MSTSLKRVSSKVVKRVPAETVQSWDQIGYREDVEANPAPKAAAFDPTVYARLRERLRKTDFHCGKPFAVKSGSEALKRPHQNRHPKSLNR